MKLRYFQPIRQRPNRATVENKILTIAQAGDQIMLEYISDET